MEGFFKKKKTTVQQHFYSCPTPQNGILTAELSFIDFKID